VSVITMATEPDSSEEKTDEEILSLLRAKAQHDFDSYRAYSAQLRLDDPGLAAECEVVRRIIMGVLSALR
jgi:hypothetical protein